ncbi:DUF3306 domain-containing protein [Roseibium sp.]|uniref:DUF3306 domain-containing protein n=1 Tax=Roseibium sp. TaxID=1936156 RepID=UPI003A96EE89
MAEDKDEGFLSRWSRRKRGVEGAEAAQEAEQGDLVETEAAPVEPDGEGHDAPAKAPAEDPELVANREAAEAVDLESLTYESDFTVFMKKGVPTALKNAALQKLWRSNPVLAVLDGLNDYDEDFRIAEGVVGHFESAWKVGKGYADKAEEVAAEMEAKSAELARAREKLAATETAEAKARANDEVEPASENDALEAQDDATQEADSHDAANEPVAEDPDVVAVEEVENERPQRVSIRRRMQFTSE